MPVPILLPCLMFQHLLPSELNSIFVYFLYVPGHWNNGTLLVCSVLATRIMFTTNLDSISTVAADLKNNYIALTAAIVFLNLGAPWLGVGEKCEWTQKGKSSLVYPCHPTEWRLLKEYQIIHAYYWPQTWTCEFPAVHFNRNPIFYHLKLICLNLWNSINLIYIWLWICH